MPWGNDPSVQALRLTYNAAVSAHADCSRALTEAFLRGDIPSPDLVDAEKQAHLRVNDARARLHEAMAQAMVRESDLTPPT
jgi:hypothetical protein